jgi:3-dehydroquinate synthase
MSAPVRVELGTRSYEVRVGQGLLARAGAELAPHLARPRVAVLTDRTVAALHLGALEAGLAAAGIAMQAHALAPGEATKGWAGLTEAVEFLLDARVERRDLVVALGGGVIGDLAGFAAAVLRRGVRFAQIPTTLLAQVDSSVGGKTGINARHGKNLVGAYHQPALVLCDIDLLATLPPRDFLAGYGEVVKYGLLGDAAFFDWLEMNGPATMAGSASRLISSTMRTSSVDSSRTSRRWGSLRARMIWAMASMRDALFSA